jgi:hypothetical protein
MTREMREAVLGAAEELGHIPYPEWKKEIAKQSSLSHAVQSTR